MVDAAFLDSNSSKLCAHCAELFYRDRRCTWAYWQRAKFCCQACAGTANSLRKTASRPPLESKFKENFDMGEGCWDWTWMKDKDGYGLFAYAGKQHRAHVIALKLDGRPVRKDAPFACHTCDNPSCVNPAHLYPGTHAQNMADAKARKRTCLGEKQHNAKLTEKDVSDIRIATGTHTEIASRYAITASNVSMIRSRRTWRHVP